MRGLLLLLFLFIVSGESLKLWMFGACLEHDPKKCIGFPINVPDDEKFPENSKLFIQALEPAESDFLHLVAQQWDSYVECGQTNYDDGYTIGYEGQESGWWIFEARFTDGGTMKWPTNLKHQRVKRIIDAWADTDGPPQNWREKIMNNE